MKKIFLFVLLLFSIASAQDTGVRRAELGDSTAVLKALLLDSTETSSLISDSLGRFWDSTEVANAIEDSINNRLSENWITPQMFGVIADDGLDDAVGFQAMSDYLSTIGGTYSGGKMFIPPGTYYLDTTWYIKNSSGEYFSFILEGLSQLDTRIIYRGNIDSAAIHFHRPSRFKILNIKILNGNASGTGIGILIQNPTPYSNAGSGLMECVEIADFNKGIYIGSAVTGNAASEITYINIGLSSNVFGILIEGSNSLNHLFYQLMGSSNGVTLKVQNTNHIYIYGGSCSNDTTADFIFIQAGVWGIYGYRSENSKKFVIFGAESGAGSGAPTNGIISGCGVAGTVDSDSSSVRIGKAGNYTIENNSFVGNIEIETGNTVYSTITLRNNAIFQDSLYQFVGLMSNHYYVRIISEGNLNRTGSTYGRYFPNEIKYYDGSEHSEEISSFQNNGFFNHDEWGSNRLFTSKLENILYSAKSRFSLSDTNFTSFSDNPNNLFDNEYHTYGGIAANDTGKIYVDFTTKNEYTSNGVIYTQGYVLVHFYYQNSPSAVLGDVYLVDSSSWTPLTDATDISNNSLYSLYRLIVPERINASKIRIFIIAGVDSLRISEIEYYPSRDISKIPVLDKFSNQSFYHKLSFKNFNNTEKAYIDSNGNAYFQDLTVVNTITVTDSIVAQTYTTDTLTVNNVSTLAAATATTLNVGTITSTNGRIQPATGGQIELDSLRNRVAKLDTLTFAFNISDPADGSYSGAIYIPNAITINKVMAVLRTAATSNDSAYVNIYFGSSIYSGASTVWSADKNVSDTTTGTSYTSFDDATVPTNTWMWVQCNNEVETVNQINITVFAKKD